MVTEEVSRTMVSSGCSTWWLLHKYFWKSVLLSTTVCSTDTLVTVYRDVSFKILMVAFLKTWKDLN